MPGHESGWYWLHARQALRPTRGEGMREAAEAYNVQLASARAQRARDLAESGSGAAAVLVAGDDLVDLGAEPGALVRSRPRRPRAPAPRARLRARAAIAEGRSIAARRERSSSWRNPIAYRTAG